MEQKGNWGYTNGPEQLRDREKEGIRTETRGEADIKHLKADILHLTSFPFLVHSIILAKPYSSFYSASSRENAL